MATDDKYDRQLRLWGANGQAALMGAHVLLLGAEPMGSKTLKNLVLPPGLGLVAVVDGGDVTASDLASNFFVEPAALGRKRADVDVQLLCEMNPDGPRAAVDPAALSRPSRPSSPTAATPPPPPPPPPFPPPPGLLSPFGVFFFFCFFFFFFFLFFCFFFLFVFFVFWGGGGV